MTGGRIFTPGIKYILILLSLLLWSCSASSPPTGQWVALVPYESITYRMVLDTKLAKPRLFNVTFKRYDVPMDTIFFDGDSLHFLFGEFYTGFDGSYDKRSNLIRGTWIKEDSVRIPVTFEPAVADTVLGMYPRKNANYVYKSPKQETDQWPVCTLSDQQIDQALMDSLTHAIMRERYPDVHSLLIARNDCLAYEEYFYTFNSAFRQNIQSVTKSFVSALAGIALEKNEIKSMDETLCDHLPAYRELACNGQNKTITLDALLSMSTGLEWDEATFDYGDDRNSASIAGKHDDPFIYLFTRPRSATPRFAYNSMNHSLMNVVLKNTTGLDNGSEITSRILTPLGITSFYLGEPEHGVLGDIELRPRDMMKLGQLYLQRGSWNNKQLVSATWVRESTSLKSEVEPELGYGYFWWIKEFVWKGKSLESFFAWGYGGQYIFVVPELKLVVAMTGSHWTTDPKNHAMEMMEKFIIQACR